MSIFVDGIMLAEDQNQTTPLEQFPGAIIGCKLPIPAEGGSLPYLYSADIRIGQFIVFNRALSENQRRDVEEDLRREYGL